MPTIRSGASVCALAVLSCAMVVLGSARAFAGPVPGDPSPYQTAGQVIGTYAFTVNTTTYSNVTLDAADISELVEVCRDTDLASAYTIWTTGKNSIRTYGQPLVYRVPKTVVERVYTGEDWYTAAIAYYSTESAPNRYLGKYIEDALKGEGDFQAQCKGVRAEVVKAGMLFYPLLYFYHEVDAGIAGMRSIPTFASGDSAAQASAVATLYSGSVEVQDGWACYYNPDAKFAQQDPNTAAVSTNRKTRVGGPYSPWEVQQSLHQFFCNGNGNGSPASQSPINRDMLATAKAMRTILNTALAKNPAISSWQVDEMLTELRLTQQSLLNIHQVQLTMKSVYEACRTPDRKSNDCERNSTCTRAKSHWAAAWAHWRLAEPTFQNAAYAPKNIVAARLQAVRVLLNPITTPATNFKPTRDQCRIVYEAVQSICNDFGYPSGYSWESVVGRPGCKRYY